MNEAQIDLAIIGGGIVGLATAYTLIKRHPHLKLVVLEKEQDVATHQTGHNSGVIHSGIYYRPGSLKARLCRQGAQQLIKFCEQHGIHFNKCGKVIVATTAAELSALDTLYERGLANHVPGIEKIDESRLHEIEPHASGLAALYSPETAIVDYRQVAAKLHSLIVEQGAQVRTGTRLLGAIPSRSGVRLQTNTAEFVSKFLINCAGLYSDIVAPKMGLDPQLRIIPFRGEITW